MRALGERADLKKSPREADLRVALIRTSGTFVVYDASGTFAVYDAGAPSNAITPLPPRESGGGEGSVSPPLPPSERGRGEGSSAEAFAVPRGFLAYWADYRTGEFSVYGRRLFDQEDVAHALRNLQRDLDVNVAPLLELDPDLTRAFLQTEAEPEDETPWRTGGDPLIEMLRAASPDDAPQGGIAAVSGDDDGGMVSPDAPLNDTPICVADATVGADPVPRRMIPDRSPVPMSDEETIQFILNLARCGGWCPRCSFIGCPGHNLEENPEDPMFWGPCGTKNCAIDCVCCLTTDECCDYTCCHPHQNVYCYHAPDPHHSKCCPNGTFGCGNGDCCHPGEVCCNDSCGPPGCCLLPDEEGCLQTNETCCVTEGTPDGYIAYNGEFFGGGSTCCNGQCCGTSTPVCCPDGHCCQTGQTCCGPSNCCDADQRCCGRLCYDLATEQCCDDGSGGSAVAGAGEPQICPIDQCCGDLVCCAPPCEVCLSTGWISLDGWIDILDTPVCVGESLAFQLYGATDHAGSKRKNCATIPDGPVVTTVTWRITKPDGTFVEGGGRSAGITADLPGTYGCSFTVQAIRECPPPPVTVGPAIGSTPEYRVVDIKYNTFIRCGYIQAVWPSPTWPFYSGDGRIFGENGTSRTHQEIVVSVDPSRLNGVVSGPIEGNDISHGYITLNQMPPPPDWDWCDFLCRWTAGPGQTPNCSGHGPQGFHVTPERVTNDEIKIRFEVSAQLGCSLPGSTPTIDVDVTAHLRQVCQAGVLNPLELKIDGLTDRFPWQEFLFDGFIYRVIDPCALLTDPNALFGPQTSVFLDWHTAP